MILNQKTTGTELYEIEFTPKGSKETKSLYVYAKNALDASNYLILNKIWGKQHRVICCTVNAINNKEKARKQK